jgi:hypothetical protein
MPDVSLNGIEFQIKGSTGNASSSIDSLVKKLDSLKTALANAGNVKVLANGLKNLQKAMESIAKSDVRGTTSALKELGKTAESLQGLANISKDLASFARAMAKLAEDPSKLLNLAQALQVIGSVDLTNLAAASDSMRAFADAMKAVNGGGGSKEVETQATAWDRLGGAMKTAGAGFWRFFTFPFAKGAKDVGSFAKSLGGVIGGFKRILGYRIIRSIIKEITQAFGEGIKNLYGWSKAMGGAMVSGKTFAETMDGLATSSLYFKNSIGAMVAPIISALAPAIDYIIDKVVALINVINQLMALLGGATSWNKAIRKATEFEDAAGGAGGAAKEALRYLAPFDELNRLPDDNKGGGGGGSADDYSGMFEEQTEFLEGLKDFADSIRAAIDAGDWEGLGVLIGDKVNELIEKIDFASLGTKVGEKINALFTTEYWTLNTINFQNIGKKIAEFLTGENGIGGALREIDFSNIGGIMAEKLTALPEVLIGVVNNLDFSVVGKSLGDTIRGFLDGITEFIQNVDWGETLENAITGMFDFIGGLDIQSLAKSVLSLLGSVVGAVADGLGTLMLDLVDVIIDPNTWTLVGAWLQDLPAKLKNIGINAINAFVAPLTDGINSWIEKYNGTALAEKLGKIEPLSFELIPTIPQEELTKHYDEAKRIIEENSKSHPVGVEVGLIPKPNENGELFDLSDLSKKPIEIPSTANFTGWEVKGSKDKSSVKAFSTWSSTANYVDWSVYGQKGKSVIDQFTTWDSTANWSKQTTDKSWKGTTWNATANWAKQTTASTWPGTTWNATANWKTQTTDAKWKGTTWNATANWTSQTTGSTWPGTTWASTANFTRYLVANGIKDESGNLIVRSKVNVVGQSNTPTISAKLKATAVEQATGGAYYGGSWHSIPQYAAGGKVHGSMFIAGEAGPEIVGHVGGRTEVLNQSQLAATMYAAVSSAMNGLRIAVSAPSASAYGGDNGVDEETMYRAFSRALADSDLGGDIELDGETVYRSVVRRNRQNTRATGVNQLAMA